MGKSPLHESKLDEMIMQKTSMDIEIFRLLSL